MVADVARRRRGRAVLRAADPLGQADERADDLGRPLRLVHRPHAATATSTATPPARPGRRSPPRCSRSGARWSPPTRDPDCCLVNFYGPTRPHGPAPRRRRGGLRLAGALDQPRRPRASSAWAAPPAPTRPPRSCSRAATSWSSAAPARLAYHGIDRIRAGASRLLPEGGRINLTLPRRGLTARCAAAPSRRVPISWSARCRGAPPAPPGGAAGRPGAGRSGSRPRSAPRARRRSRSARPRSGTAASAPRSAPTARRGRRRSPPRPTAPSAAPGSARARPAGCAAPAAPG